MTIGRDIARGLLRSRLGGARPNLLAAPSAFDTGSWSKSGITVAANGELAPNGTLTAEKLAETNAAGTHGAQQFVSGFVSGNPYTHAVSAKAGERSWLWIFLPGAAFATSGGAYFDLANGVVGTVAGGVRAKMVPAGLGFWRCSITQTANNNGNGNVGAYVASANGTASYTGSTGSGITVWGAKLELGANASPFIG